SIRRCAATRPAIQLWMRGPETRDSVMARRLTSEAPVVECRAQRGVSRPIARLLAAVALQVIHGVDGNVVFGVTRVHRHSPFVARPAKPNPRRAGAPAPTFSPSPAARADAEP